MTENTTQHLPGIVAGIQLGVFELIWPTFRWIKSIWIKHTGDIHLFVEVAGMADREGREDCDRMLGELIDVAKRNHPQIVGARLRVDYGSEVPGKHEYRELMSDHIFRQIAEKHAPWRLDSGR
jgi:hypothetical protein